MADQHPVTPAATDTDLRGAGAPASAPLSHGDGFLPHIESLRAVAVAGVILFHLDPAYSPGGYLGVDIFFVISGYLMARHIAASLATGSFSPAAFWQRRIARLVPALAVVLLTVAIAFPPLMHPGELRTLGVSLAAAGAFVSNLLFWRTTGYFSDPGTNPLLHSWTLGVEEQFYLVFPIAMMMAFRRSARSPLWWIAAISILALTVQICRGPDYHVDNFFLLNARIWEFGAGAVLALAGVSGFARQRAREAAALAGWLMIAAGYAVLPGGPSPWQHLFSLLPVAGASIIIANGNGSVLGPLLAAGPVRLTGRISYSLYLWHMPLVVWVAMSRGSAGPPAMHAAILAATFVAAFLTHKYVEVPGRAMVRRWRPRQAFAFAAGFALAFGALGGLLAGLANSWRTYTPDDVRLLAYATPAPVIRQCSLAPGKRIEDCPGYSPRRRSVLLMGDSHAGVIIDALRDRLSDANLADVRMAGCRPLFRWTYYGRCQLEKEYAFATLIPSRRFTRVILASDWKPGDADDLRQVITMIRRHGVDVTLVGPGQRFHLSLIRLLLSHDPQQVARARDTGQKAIDAELRRLAHSLQVQYVSRYDIECPRGDCRVRLASGAPLLFDAHHLTRDASRYEVAHFPDMP